MRIGLLKICKLGARQKASGENRRREHGWREAREPACAKCVREAG